ncbi:14 kDa phosphohistidine phosphatase-like [Phymastichus coffea]|uniref:14 kDa phosphohistidine phosphatase-like n=1 Tax=Phymastichus coffea TaxID=108790 RepID=UPI00273C2278|nr:14 kDa phosphohistidine phosphatase-like [Phymastichus coffea]
MYVCMYIYVPRSFTVCLMLYIWQSARQVLKISITRFSKMSQILDIADVDIDPNGDFKYILIQVKEKGKNDFSRTIVRGYAGCDYHADIFKMVEAELEKVSSNLKAICRGGGRIQHDASDKKMKVYGYSEAYGKANHKMALGILKKRYPDYKITWSYESF